VTRYPKVRKFTDKAGMTTYRVGGLYHRIGGPAVHWRDGSQYWYENGRLHRIDGPAIYEPNAGEQHFYIHGLRYQSELHYRVALANMTEEEKRSYRQIF
jgi:hypothetical protein